MGVYLSSPITDKESIDEECERFVYGASSMQGWRITQEDAHNCIPVFEEKAKTSFFAVYDGHGGSEVAKYCERHFPDFVKDVMNSYNKSKDPIKSIQNAFLAFDATLTNEDVIKELKELAGKDDEADEDDEDDPVGHTETDRLKEEANMPLDQLLAQYKAPGKPVEDAKDKLESFQSPALHAKTVNYKDNNNSNSRQGVEKVAEQPSSSSSLRTASSTSVESSAASSSSQQASNAVMNGKVTNCNNNSTEEPQKPDTSVLTSADKTSRNNNNIDKVDNTPVPENGNISSTEKVRVTSCSSNAVGSAGSSKAEAKAGGSCTAVSSRETGSRRRVSKSKATVGMAHTADSSDDDEEEEMWEDMSDDDDDEDEENGEDVPMMDMTNEEPGSDSGCTACVVLMQDNKVIVANSGDSRCVLARAGKAVELSFDHKPEDDIERARIETAGGKVTADGRVNGGLNLSRAIGDHVYKRNKNLPAKDQMITALPDIEIAELGPEDQFLVIACDGIWNYMSSQEVVDYVLNKLSDPEKRKKPSIICEELFDHCLAPNTFGDGTGCDNMTCVIIVLNTLKASDTMSAATATVTSSSDNSKAAGSTDSILKDFHSTTTTQAESTTTPSSENGRSKQESQISSQQGDDEPGVGVVSLKRCSENVEEVGGGKRLKREVV